MKQNHVVLGTSSGSLIQYSIPVGRDVSLLPQEDRLLQTELKSGCICAIAMDDKNEEGMIGTDKGKILYVCLKETKDRKIAHVPLVSKASTSLDAVTKLRLDPANPKVFMANCGSDRGEVKLVSSSSLDTVFTFKDSNLGPVKFIASTKARKADHRLIGYADGMLRFVSLFEL